MTLAVALLGEQLVAEPRGTTTWGTWRVHPWLEPTTLAMDDDALDPQVRQLLVLVPSAGRLHAHIAASTLAAVRPDVAVRVAAFPVSLGVLLRAVEMVPDRARGGNEVLADIEARLAGLTWGAWLPSVAKLESPTPSLGQHVRSWFPQSQGFLAVHPPADGDGWVAALPVPQLDPGRLLSRVPPRGIVASAYDCHAFGELPEHAISTLFSLGLTTRPVRREPVVAAAPTWGTDKAVEFVISWPGGAQVEDPAGHCPVCEEPVWRESCAFCRSRVVPGAPSAHHPVPSQSDLATTRGVAS